MSRIPSLEPIGRRSRFVIGCGIALVVFALAMFLRRTGPVDALELQLVDLRTRHVAGEIPADERILICQVQDTDIAWVRKTLNEPWPWPLDYNAFLVGILEAGGAKALMVDILHLDRGAGPGDLPSESELDPAEQARREGEAESARTYGAALESLGSTAVGFELTSDSSYELPARVQAALGRLGLPEAKPLAAATPALERDEADLPVLGVLKGARLLGFTNAPADRDGIVRRATLEGSWKGRRVISLPLATLRAMEGALNTALDRDASFVVDFRSRERGGGYARIEPARLLSWALAKEQSGTLPPEAAAALGGKVVVLGINSAGIQDVVATPVGTLDGPVFQATVLDNLLNGGGRTSVSDGLRTLFLLLITFGIALPGTLSANRVGPHLIPVLVGVAYVFLAFELFSSGQVADLFVPLLCVFFTWGGATMFRLLTAGRRNKWLEGTFGRYVAPTIIESLKQDPTMLKLGGRKRDITVLFSDVANFTTASEQLGAEKTVALLNRYLTDHCKAVFDNDGIVDKFEGDAVMAFFGDPLPQGDHPVRACRAALKVIEDLPKLEPVWREMGLDAFAIRIGLNSGSAFVGNMGSEQRFDYTCMGNTVNVASRIEGANKLFDTEIMVGPLTEENARDEFLFKPLGRIQVIGAKEPLAVFELMAERSSASESLREHVACFVRALEAVRLDDLDQARQELAGARTSRPDDGPCAWLEALVDDLESGYTKRPWNGLTQQRSK